MDNLAQNIVRGLVKANGNNSIVKVNLSNHMTQLLT